MSEEAEQRFRAGSVAHRVPDLGAMELLLAVARLGSLGGAARELGITQPAASSRYQSSESSLQPDTVSLSGLASEEAARTQLRAGRDQLDACSEFTMEVSNQEIRTTVSEVDVDTAADEDLALRTTARVPGTIQESITVRAVVGSTVVDVLVGGSPDPAADAARAERLTDLVAAELRAR